MVSDTQSGHKIKDNNDADSKRRHTSHKGSTTSGSAGADNSGLRSTSETSSRNQSLSSNSITQDSERFAKFEKGSSSLDSRSKREKRGKNVKQHLLDDKEWNRNDKQKPKPSRVILKKKRLDARSYRTLLRSHARIFKGSDLGLKLKRKNKQSTGASYHTQAGGFKEVEDVDACNERREEEEEAIGLFSHLSCKQRNHCEEIPEFESKDKSLVCQSGDSSQRLSPVGAGAKEAVDKSKDMQVEFSADEGFQRLDSMKPVSEGMSIDGDSETEGINKSRTPKRKTDAINMNSDNSKMEASQEICSVSADVVSSSSSGSKMINYIERSVVFSKRQRVVDSCGREFCSWNAEDKKEPEAGDATRLTEECHYLGQDNGTLFIIRAEADQNACVVCKLGGNLLSCDGKGCKRNFHLSCLDPPLKDVPPGAWHCFLCVKKKIIFGVHSVSDGVESIWDVRQVNVSEKEGKEVQRQKEYLVKYKGLAHVHNRWVPESQLLQEVPLLVAKFNRKNQYKVMWKSQWTVPHRLLQKRPLMSSKQRDDYKREHCMDITDCYHEWLVKWSDLGYEHVTWEFETSTLLRSTEAMKLIGDYEVRRQKAKGAFIPSRTDKEQQEIKGSFFELSKLPGGALPGFEYHLTFVNKLREYWYKGQKAFLIYDQERYMKVILFILSLQSDAWRPSLIVSSDLSAWETEFWRLAPSINVVAYSGNIDVRKSIRALEFYEESGCVMFQVLLSTPDAIVEDLEVLECIGWEALVVDDCQQSQVSKYCEQLRCLSTDFRLLVASGQIRDSLADYLNLLKFLDSGVEEASPDGSMLDSSDNIDRLKERLAQFVPFQCKSESSKFVEYWVPDKLSSVQLELYCSTLLSNEMSLRSCSKNDSVGILRELLTSARKCCDHPYLLEPSLQTLLTKGLPEVEYLDVGIKASGKLQLLDKILKEIKRRGLRTLILFQSLGGSRLGDILDDFLRQRFGLDSYERVDGLVSSKKKQAAVNMFNSRERGRFVFLLENRACHPSIRLSSVDTIILFDSDWNPLNDLRGLQRIHIDSQFDQPKVFRLYTSCTVEEKILSLATQDISLDSNIHNLSHNTCQTLLIWCASILFSKLDGFHGGTTTVSDSNILSSEPFMNAVVEELFRHLPHNAESEKNNWLFVSKVKQSGATYSRDIPLLGESEMQLVGEEAPHVFWTKLLQGRCPRWKYLSGSSPRVRKRVQYFEKSPRKSDIDGDEVTQKCKKVANNTANPFSHTNRVENKKKLLARGKEGTPVAQAGNEFQSLSRSAVMSDKNHVCSMQNGITSVSDTHLIKNDERRKLHDAQKSLHLLLKPEISKLCDILHLPGYIKVMAEKFLQYIMNNHHVNREPVAILQAFQISVCWTAAASFEHKIDHKESLEHIKQLLNFECKEEEVEFIYSKLWMLKKAFCIEDSSSRMKNVSEILLCASSSQKMTSVLEELGGKIGDNSESCNFPQHVPTKEEQATDFDNTSWSEKNDVLNISQFEKICAKRTRKLLRKQQKEIQRFNEFRQKEKANLEKELTMKLVLIHALDELISIKLDKMKMAEEDHAKKIEENNRRWKVLRENLEALQLLARNGEKQMKAYWLAQAKSGESIEQFAKLPLLVSGFNLEEMMASELSATQISGPNSGKSDPNITFPSKQGQSLPYKTIEGSGTDATLVVQPNREDGVVNAVVVPFNGDSNRIGAMLDMQPNIKDDGTGAAVALQSNEDRNRLDTILGMQPSRVDGRVGANSIVMQSNGNKNELEGTTAMHPTGVNVTAQPHKDFNNGSDAASGVESCREDNAMYAIAPEREFLAGHEQHSRAHGADIDLSSMEPTQIVSHSIAQPHVTIAQNSSLPLDEHCEPIEATVQDKAAPSCEMQNSPKNIRVPSHHLADVFPPDDPNHDTSVMESFQQLPVLLSTDPPSTVCGQQDESVMGSRHVTTNEDHTSNQQGQLQEPLMDSLEELSNHSDFTPLVEDHSEPSHSPQQSISPLPLHLPVETSSVGSGALASDTSMTTLPGSSNCPQIVQLAGSGACLSATGGVGTVQGSSNHQPQITVATQVCPLQREIEILQKEKEQAIKSHGDLKLHLESECEKEIQDIRGKYTALLQEAESTLVEHRKAQDANYNKAFMNWMLAQAFRSKFSGQKASGVQELQQGMSTSFTQRLSQLSSHQHAQRPAPLSSTPAAQPLPVAHYSFVHLSSNLARQLNRPVPLARNFQVTGEQRAPAPHLQRFRPSTSMSAPSIQPHPQTIPNQQALGNAASTSLVVPQLASQVATHSSRPFSSSQQLETAGGLEGSSGPSLSSLELQLDVGNHLGVKPPSLLRPLSDLGPTLDALDLSEPTTYGR